MVCIVSCLFCLSAPIASADTVYLKEGSSQKGVILEETQKSVIMSTAEGEKEFFFDGVTDIEYDQPEKNLFHTGLQLERQGNRAKAIDLYQQAITVNSQFTKAKDRIVYLRSLARYEQEHLSQKKIDQKEGALQRWNVEPLEKSLYDLPQEEKNTILHRQLGIEIEQDGLFPVVKNTLRLPRPFHNTFQTGDRIVEIWGESARYEGLDAVIDKLIGPRFSQIKLVIERTLRIERQDARFATAPLKALGVTLQQEPSGIEIVSLKKGSLAEKSGVLKHDYLVGVNGATVRYMSLSQVANAMKGKDVPLDITVQRTMWLMRGELK
ncbi:MAG: PDZ domain-containing protein [Candidatus Omnitrophica bacterium]|nr:PDZ domain-containing protein [Candidatus Omnitrophota bacterium]